MQVALTNGHECVTSTTGEITDSMELLDGSNVHRFRV